MAVITDCFVFALHSGEFCTSATPFSSWIVLCSPQLRVLYECNPMAFIVEQAGGKASDGRTRILDLQPKDIHERSPIFMGSKEDVEDVEALYRKHSK